MTDRRAMVKLVEGLGTKSDKMRKLASAGYSRAAIAAFLNVRYQFVRNVLVEEERRKSSRSDLPPRSMGEDPKKSSRAEDEDPAFAREVLVGKDGALQLPPVMLESAGIRPGDAVLVRFGDGQIEIYSRTAAIERTQAEIRKYVPDSVSLVDELLRARRQEAKREQGGA